jgi:hypothetical protein
MPRMTLYGNRSGESGVRAFEEGDDWIMIEFVADSPSAERFYRYTNASAGAAAVFEMKRLAAAGEGLSTYVARNNPDYESKR